MSNKEITLCAINNTLSGSCLEDCKFCAQSAKYRANIDRYHFKEPQIVLKEAKRAKALGASGYCLVTSGKGLDDKRLEYIANLAKLIKSKISDIRLIACSGVANLEQLKYLKKSGIDSYNHNLETSKEFYKEICSTHSWQERYDTAKAVKLAGLSLCCGGIFGMGESKRDREALLDAIASLEPESTPLNFFIPNPSLPLKERNIDKEGALEVIKMARKKLPNLEILMVAGGREQLFSRDLKEIFEAGANSIVIGNYLTTKGEEPNRDKEEILRLGYSIRGECGRA